MLLCASYLWRRLEDLPSAHTAAAAALRILSTAAGQARLAPPPPSVPVKPHLVRVHVYL